MRVSLALGGRCFDAVVLHTFFTDETTARVVRTVKDAAEQAGRDPDAVRVWSCFATIGDHLPEDVRLKKTVGRLGTYLQGYGDLLVETNRWDPKVLERFRADAFVQGFRGGLDMTATTEELEHVATLIPEEWLAPAASVTLAGASCDAPQASDPLALTWENVFTRNTGARQAALSPDGSTVAVTADDMPVGHVTVQGNELVHLFIDPEHQGGGMGRRLLAAGEDLLAADGHPRRITRTNTTLPWRSRCSRPCWGLMTPGWMTRTAIGCARLGLGAPTIHMHRDRKRRSRR